METSQSAGLVERKDEKERLDDFSDDMQERTHTSSSGRSDLSLESPKRLPQEAGMVLNTNLALENSNTTSRIVDSHEEHDEPEAIPAGNLECSKGEAGREQSQELGFDRLLPPIRIRREGQSSDSSLSDLSPPSPKRMRQAPKEKDQWLGLWNFDESKGSAA